MKFEKLQQKLTETKKIVWPLLEKYLPKKFPEKHYEIIADYPQRQGKYFRPSLLLLANELFNGKQKDALLCATAMQLSEDWLLIHDDVEDHSEERRHAPSLNQIWGDELAINAGDSLHLIMWQVMGDAMRQLNDARSWQIFDNLNHNLQITTEGQFLELSWIQGQILEITSNDYYEMIDRKTAHYTIITPLQLGAICSNNATPVDLENFSDWGIPFGRAFQIWDDLMNIESTSAIQGKENGGDILEGKRTLLLIHLLNNCSATEKTEIIKIYKKNRAEKTMAEKIFIQELFYKYASVDYAKNEAKRFAKRAQENFQKIFKQNNSEAKKIIAESIEFVVQRKA